MLQMSPVAPVAAVAAPIDAFAALVVRRGYASPQSAARAERVGGLEGQRTDVVLNRLGLISDEHYATAWSEVLDLPVAGEDEYPDSPVLADRIKPAFLINAGAVPLRIEEGTLVVALDPLDDATAAALEKRTGFRIKRMLGQPGHIARALERLYPAPTAAPAGEAAPAFDPLAFDVERLRDLASDAPVIRLVQMVIETGVEANASDIHLSIDRTGPRLQLRIDGLLRDIEPPPLDLYGAVLSRIKILAGLDIAEQRLPQDGGMRAVCGGREIDLRVATMPHVHGEGAVLRILDKSAIRLDFEALGIADVFVRQLTGVLSQPSGLVLMTGPTGSGKTTTLYAALKATLRPDRNVVTIEDPVEHQLAGIKQISVNHKIDLDFARALRAVLRQDPDVIMVGEIRDQETAQIAARAALTGHLVIATVHTNSAVAALPRLIDMGVEPYLVASTVRAVMAQRLVRRLCEACRRPLSPAAEKALATASGRSVETTVFTAAGCAHCRNTGFKGRVAICEFIPVSEGLAGLVTQRADTASLTSHAVSEGARLLMDDAWSRVLDGTTSPEEVERVIGLG